MSPTTTISRCGGGGGAAFGSLAVTIAGPNTLRGLWALSETASPWLDTSGWSSGPSDMHLIGSGTLPTTGVPGCLAPSQDIGFIKYTVPIRGNQFLGSSNSLMFQTGVDTTFTVAGWVNATASASSWRGAIFHNSSMQLGTPNKEQGWTLEGQWLSGAINFRFIRFVDNIGNICSVAGGFNQCVFLVGTYDGANLRLYAQAVLVATVADARVPTFTGALSAPQIGEQVIDAGLGLTNDFQWFGKLGYIAFWSVVLTPAQIAQLYAAGLS